MSKYQKKYPANFSLPDIFYLPFVFRVTAFAGSGAAAGTATADSVCPPVSALAATT
jgi:hypothetical protein